MSKLKIVQGINIADEIEEINLPMFDFEENTEENWFTKAIKQHEECLKKMEEESENEQ